MILPCPGWYCGRVPLPNGTLSACGSCPRGFRRNDTTFICEPCTDSPTFYDWLYLGFMVLLVQILHWFFIDMVSMRRSFKKDVLILHLTALVEVAVSGLLAVLFTHPFGEFHVRNCRVRSLADWYTLVHNPAPNYEKRVHCTQEAVYPLYTLVFIFYALTLVVMLLIRPWVCRKYLPRQSKMSIYAAMYYIPILVVVHALIGGLLYYAFPILVVILSVISCAYHFALKINQSIPSLIITTVVDPRNVVILVGHWCLHAYGLISITQLSDPTFHSLLLLLVPLPAFFYIFTARFTDPTIFT
ncbi:JNK1/MAPK8-associated membrane protein [Tribolium madens]|uniref:JNK1/MAPK8-associated membrane protein n=1 Tax=Tribolium madens TaxID=41895 RepID=UPI001CF7258A|nr:JNK1/MAPK8-associated membrane protein [Tribolium madens]